MITINWGTILANLGISTVIFSVVGFVARSVFLQFLSRGLEVHKKELQLASDRELTRLTAELRLQVDQDHYRFSILHKKRAAVLQKTYALLVRVHFAAASYLSVAEFSGEPSKKEKYKILADLGNKLSEYFLEHKIYFSQETCQKFETTYRTIKKPTQEFLFASNVADSPQNNPNLSNKKDKVWFESAEKLNREVPPLMEALEADFRQILGVDEQWKPKEL